MATETTSGVRMWEEPGYGIFNKMDYETYQEHVNRYSFASNFVKDKAVLDLGCGIGYGTEFLRRKGAKEAVGADVYEPAINYAEENYKTKGLSFTLLSGERYPFPNDFFDVVVVFEVIEHLTEPIKLLRECKRILCVGGVLICSTPNRKFYSLQGKDKCSEFHVREYTVTEFTDVINSLFADVQCYGQNFAGLFAILKFIAVSIVLKVILRLPKGNQIKNLLEKLYNMFALIPSVGQTITENSLDRRYEVKPFIDRKFSIPSDIVIVACKKGG